MLTARVFRGAGWLVASRLTGRAIDFVTLLVLARVLNPADFGLTALAGTLISIVDMVFEIPLSQALTRLRSIKPSHLDTAFTLGFLRSLVLATVLLAAAWPFAAFYRDPRLTPLVAVLAGGPMIRALYSPAMVMAVRSLSFQKIFVNEVSGKLCAFALALLVVRLDGGYWAIAVNSIAAPMVATTVSYVLAPYRPRLSLVEMPDFAGFLGWFSSAQLVAALNYQFDRVLLGHFVTRAALGQYTMASDLATLPTQSLIGPAMQSVMAAFSTMSDDRERIRRAFLKAAFLTMLVAMPICVGISVTADMIIHILLGDKWAQAAFYLQFLPLTILLSAYYQVLYSLALALNRPSILFRMNVTELTIRIAAISLGLYLFSIDGVIAARGVLSMVMFCLALRSSHQLAGADVAQQLTNLRKIALACTLMGIAVLALRAVLAGLPLGIPLELAGAASFGALVYAAILVALGVRLLPRFELRGWSPSSRSS